MGGQQEAQQRQQQFEQVMATQTAAMQQNMKQNMMNAAMQQQMMNSMAIQGTVAAAQAQATQQRSRNNIQGKHWQQQVWGNIQRNFGNHNNSFPINQAFTPNNFANNFNKQGGRQLTPPNPLRIFENNNYCWTHDHLVENNHTSQMCTMSDPGHQAAATKANTMGGSTSGAHKVIMPSQSGHTPINQQQRSTSKAYLQWKAAGFPDVTLTNKKKCGEEEAKKGP